MGKTNGSTKTAISLDADLLARMDEVAEATQQPRSRLFARAAEELLRRYENTELMRSLEVAYALDETEEEARGQRAHRSRHASRIQDTW